MSQLPNVTTQWVVPHMHHDVRTGDFWTLRRALQTSCASRGETWSSSMLPSCPREGLP